ncbi:hypothetical protein ABB37_06135 [Leptomonas pyrrhocoris]|uniref:MSP domain-containing protein n=1 Tax=Leptomonas pyrrhocoris TaxID=157538 RepID=A0A0M9FYI1_LEPPY|nr:hypothetical protein ABB37_06135 [Leptomonas pyrrhocoris]KPA78529.1 hypothetical protein ABB37_06135 [Leptomonas pyrrhocoris]|eukprot:XP_015656968.1 hypothetical protein ABB37_06135 [Leptomonas pyrrhocoris]
MPILPKFANVLQFDYEIPPRISPGLSWEVTLRFRPRENTDFSTALYLKAEEGYFKLPISTSRKAFLFSVEPSTVDFGTVVVGEEQTRHITLRNKGALSGTVIVGGAFKSLLDLKQTNPVNGKKVSFFHIFPQQYKMEVPPFSTLDIAVKFAPLSAITLDTNITLTDKNNSCEVFTIPITGASTELPVYLAKGKIDFGACFFNEQYWDEVTIVNRTNITAVADFRIPAALSTVISVSPSRACVQPGEQYIVQVAFTTTKKMPRDFSSTVECVVRGQTLPLPLKIGAILSERCPQLPTTTFDVGKLILNTTHVVEVPVTNESSVVQLVGFESLPTWIKASRAVLEMVPQETSTFHLTVEPPQKGRFSQRLRVINEFGDSQTITISGQGVGASFGMSSRTLRLPACTLGSSVSATTVLFNASEKAGEFCFAVPNSFFRVSPDTGVLQPGESIPIAVLFNAPTEFEAAGLSLRSVASQRSMKNKRDAPAATVSDGITAQKRAMYDDWESGNEYRMWSKHRQFRLKCDINNGSEDSFLVSVRCCAVKPLVYIEEVASISNALTTDAQNSRVPHTLQSPKKHAAPAGEAEQMESESKQTFEIVLDYGKVPIHCVSMQQCLISNKDPEYCFVRAPPMNPLSAFSVLSYAFNGVATQCGTNVYLAFQPRKYGKYCETLRFELASQSGRKTSVLVRAQGVCNPTQLTISIADSAPLPEKGQSESFSQLYFHCTQKNDSVKKSLSFFNVGSSPLAVVINGAADDTTLCSEGHTRCSFLVHPRIFTVAPNSKHPVHVVFAPADEGLHSQRLSIAASGETREVALEGRCVKSVVYALVPHTFAGSVKVVAISFTEDIGCRPEFPVSLTFEENESKTIVVGSVGNGPTGEYELLNWEKTRSFAIPPDWSVTPPSQPILAGKEARLCIQRISRGSDKVHSAGLVGNSGALFPLRFTIVLKGEAASVSQHNALYVVCSSA